MYNLVFTIAFSILRASMPVDGERYEPHNVYLVDEDDLIGVYEVSQRPVRKRNAWHLSNGVIIEPSDTLSVIIQPADLPKFDPDREESNVGDVCICGTVDGRQN